MSMSVVQLVKAARESAQIDNSRMAGRKLVIEKKKEEQERLLLQAEREEEEKRLIQERQTLAAEEERRRADRSFCFSLGCPKEQQFRAFDLSRQAIGCASSLLQSAVQAGCCKSKCEFCYCICGCIAASDPRSSQSSSQKPLQVFGSSIAAHIYQQSSMLCCKKT